VNADGIYTPLVAWGNTELADLTTAGTGAPGDPYVLESNEPHPIDAVFGAMNDFLFPVFPGILLVDTNATVHVTPPSLAIGYAPAVAANLSAAGLPATNHLQIELWNVTNLSLLGGAAITGWLSSNVGFSPIGAVILWNGSGDLVAGNTFYDQGISLALYGGTNNTVWGNSFLNSSAPATNLSAVENSGNNTTGIWESESGDLIYNNFFELPAPAYTPTTDPVSCEIVCEPATYVDRWNVTEAPAATVQVVLGTNLSGSIIGTSYQGGNYWSNYGTRANPLGRLPYDDGGRITVGGDYVPLVRLPAFPVAFDARGLAAGIEWGVVVAGVDYRTNGTTLTVYSPNGTYNYSVLAPANYTAVPGGNFTVNGTGTEVTVVFSPLVALTFVESGLLSGWTWNVSIAAPSSPFSTTVENSTNGTIVFEVVPGNYDWNVSSYGYNASPANGVVAVGATATEAPEVVFELAPALVFTAAGLLPSAAWTVEITGGPVPLNYTSTGRLALTVFELPAGAYAWSVTAVNYTVTPGTGSGSAATFALVPLRFSIVAGTLLASVNVAGAYVYVDGVLETLTAGGFSLSLDPGVYSIVAEAPGYQTYFSNVTVASAERSSLVIELLKIPTSTASPPGGISSLGWALIGLLAVVAAGALVLAAQRRRTPPPPAPVVPYAATSASPPAGAASVPPSAKPPWQEDADDTSASPPSR